MESRFLALVENQTTGEGNQVAVYASPVSPPNLKCPSVLCEGARLAESLLRKIGLGFTSDC